MVWWKRYEPLLEARPRDAVDVVKDLLGQELCEICEAFPPPPDAVQWEDPRLRERFEPILGDLPPVDLSLVEVLAQLLRWDLSHQYDAIDHMFRNDGHRAGCPTRLHVEALHFLWPLMTEVLLSRKDELQGSLKRKDLVDVVDRFERQYRRRRMTLQ